MAHMQVLPGWIDYNGHMNEARYLQAFADATDAFLRLIGQTPVALLITLLVAMFLLRRGRTPAELEKIMDRALAPICTVILVTGAGGMFGGILRASGIGTALAGSLLQIKPVLTFDRRDGLISTVAKVRGRRGVQYRAVRRQEGPERAGVVALRLGRLRAADHQVRRVPGRR